MSKRKPLMRFQFYGGLAPPTIQRGTEIASVRDDSCFHFDTSHHQPKRVKAHHPASVCVKREEVTALAEPSSMVEELGTICVKREEVTALAEPSPMAEDPLCKEPVSPCSVAATIKTLSLVAKENTPSPMLENTPSPMRLDEAKSKTKESTLAGTVGKSFAVGSWNGRTKKLCKRRLPRVRRNRACH